MTHRIPTWTLVALGLALNILAALMTNFVIDDLGEKAADISEKQSDNGRLIALSWQQIDGLERRREAIITTLSIYDAKDQKLPVAVSDALLANLKGGDKVQLPDTLSFSSLEGVMAAINHEQAFLRDRINQLYATNLDEGDAQKSVSREINLYRNLALFIQILGLGLIMAKDLSRR
ncbi:hypothetical protein [Veronia pacifica]|uniref:DNA mismatch repair protein n=1 Tax=Veronia pacifica TaxID=1080227 RepID=A0A1C3ESH9_9GAMM|nr:hypothetical protein [Veronia pacifica]ODA36184.1 hypothetical protein A8L45_00850 [Veronia pacifica]